MTNILHFTGFIKGVTYKTYLNEPLEDINLDTFNVNQGNSYGLIKSPATENED